MNQKAPGKKSIKFDKKGKKNENLVHYEVGNTPKLFSPIRKGDDFNTSKSDKERPFCFCWR